MKVPSFNMAVGQMDRRDKQIFVQIDQKINESAHSQTAVQSRKNENLMRQEAMMKTNKRRKI